MKNPEIERIEMTVCEELGVPYDRLHEETRLRFIVQARQTSMYFAKKIKIGSLAMIGYNIGKKNHATVLHAFKAVSNLIETDKDFNKKIVEIERRLTPKKKNWKALRILIMLVNCNSRKLKWMYAKELIKLFI